jgi:hypothetical protein
MSLFYEMGMKIPRYVCGKGNGINQFSMLVLATNKGYFRKFKCYKSKVNGMFEKFKMEQME